MTRHHIQSSVVELERLFASSRENRDVLRSLASIGRNAFEIDFVHPGGGPPPVARPAQPEARKDIALPAPAPVMGDAARKGDGAGESWA